MSRWSAFKGPNPLSLLCKCGFWTHDKARHTLRVFQRDISFSSRLLSGKYWHLEDHPQGRMTIDWQCWTGNWCEIRRKDISDESGPNVTCLCFKFPVFFKSSLYLAKVISARKTLYNLRSYPIVQYALVKNVFIPCSIEQCVLNNIDIPNRITSSLTQQEKGLKVVKIW